MLSPVELRSWRLSAKAWRIASLFAMAAGAWVLYTFPPQSHSFYPPCVFRATTGLLCPGCGSTRALHALLHGRFVEALTLNPFVIAVMIGGLVSIPSLMRGQSPRFLTKPWFGWTSFVVVVSWWIARNVFWPTAA